MKIKSMIMALAIAGALYSLPDEPVQAAEPHYGNHDHCFAVLLKDGSNQRGVYFKWFFRHTVLVLMNRAGILKLPICAVNTGAFDNKVLN